MAKTRAHSVLSAPSVAMSWDNHGRRQRVEFIEDPEDNWFEAGSVEVKCAHPDGEGGCLVRCRAYRHSRFPRGRIPCLQGVLCS